MERLNSENWYQSHDNTHFRPDDEVARIMDRRSSKITQLYCRRMVDLGRLLIKLGSRLEKHYDVFVNTTPKGRTPTAV